MRRASDIAELQYWRDMPTTLPAIRKAIRGAWKRAFGDICQGAGCGVRMHFEARFHTHRHFATIDHIIDRALGGTDSLANIQVVCRTCNNRKSNSGRHLT